MAEGYVSGALLPKVALTRRGALTRVPTVEEAGLVGFDSWDDLVESSRSGDLNLNFVATIALLGLPPKVRDLCVQPLLDARLAEATEEGEVLDEVTRQVDLLQDDAPVPEHLENSPRPEVRRALERLIEERGGALHMEMAVVTREVEPDERRIARAERQLQRLKDEGVL